MATLLPVTFEAGSHTLTAEYSGDTDFNGVSGMLTATVDQDPTSTDLSVSPGPFVSGQAVTLTATVTANSPGSGSPTGPVEFFDGLTYLGTGTITVDGEAAVTVTSLGAGPHTLTADYESDTNFLGSTSADVTTTVGQDPTSTDLSVPPGPFVSGQAIVLTATVTAEGLGSGIPTGPVKFYDGTVDLGTGTLGTDGEATVTVTGLGAGSHTLTADYESDTNFLGSTSADVTTTVGQDGTSTGLTASLSSTVYGQAVTFTATVTADDLGGVTPGGSVDFYDGSTLVGTATLSGGTATFTTNDLAAGSRFVTAVYDGDANFTGSQSNGADVAVAQDGTSTGLTASVSSTVYGQAVTLTATVEAVPPGSGTPTGPVKFYDGSTWLWTGTLSDGVATFTTYDLMAGGHDVTAVYDGDVNFTGSQSQDGTASVTVAQDGTSTGLTASVPSTVYGQAVTLTATVEAAAPGSGTPAGPVEFYDGSTWLWTGTLSDGVATFTTTGLGVGPHDLTVAYGGDTNFTGSGSAAGTADVTVGQVGTTIQLISSPSPAVSGQPVTLTATVTVVLPGAGTPTGTVTFEDGTTLLGTIAVDGTGTATLTTSALAVGSHSLTATYNGDTNFQAGSPVGLTEAVVPVADLVVTPPTATQGTGTPANAVVATFTDPTGTESAAAYAATIAWGDGATDTGTVVSLGSGLYQVTGPSHTYAAYGSAYVTVTVTYADLPSVSATAGVNVAEQQVTDLVEANVPASGLKGAAVGPVAGIATFTDPAGTPDAGDFTATIAWGRRDDVGRDGRRRGRRRVPGQRPGPRVRHVRVVHGLHHRSIRESAGRDLGRENDRGRRPTDHRVDRHPAGGGDRPADGRQRGRGHVHRPGRGRPGDDLRRDHHLGRRIGRGHRDRRRPGRRAVPGHRPGSHVRRARVLHADGYGHPRPTPSGLGIRHGDGDGPPGYGCRDLAPDQCRDGDVDRGDHRARHVHRPGRGRARVELHRHDRVG
ncbi:putative internalin [Fimbriiglobus ruber]|uniref:Putative internalin n=1 Tax=Fimbriiglobus ruber TaxID=1908690 RepID=A0A225DRS9_9BACT|nr:putative internalin [Fimbriiglobus ruber]